MPNPYYDATNNPVARSRGRSQIIRDEYGLIEQGFDLVNTELAGKLDSTNPSSTGTMTHSGGPVAFQGATQVLVPTVPATGDATQNAASTAFVQNAIGALPGVVPSQAGNDGALLGVENGAIGWKAGGIAAIHFALLAQGNI